MHCERKIGKDLYWVGGNDRRIALFESAFPVPNGVSYNSYVLLGEKTALLDTADRSVGAHFFENTASALNGRGLDYIVVNHMEPDHAAMLAEAKMRYPEARIVCNAKTVVMIDRFFGKALSEGALIVKEGDTLDLGGHILTFVMAPMVHWPEVMVTYDATERTLFSADAFGTFGALSGNIFMDEMDFDRRWLDEARRYYTNICGKYGPSVSALLKKAAGLEISMICPLHGPVWRKDINKFVEKYKKWSEYEPEDRAVMIVYASVYGNTQNAAEALAARLAERGIRDIAMYDVSVTHSSVIVAEAFRCSHLVFAAPTYNAGVFVSMDNVLRDLAAHGLRGRDVGLIENGSWAPVAAKQMRAVLEGMKDMRVIEPPLTVPSALHEGAEAGLDALAGAIADSINKG